MMGCVVQVGAPMFQPFKVITTQGAFVLFWSQSIAEHAQAGQVRLAFGCQRCQAVTALKSQIALNVVHSCSLAALEGHVRYEKRAQQSAPFTT